MSFQKNFTFFDKAHKNSEVVKIFRKTVGAIHESPVTNDYHFLYSDYPLSRATDDRPYRIILSNMRWFMQCDLRSLADDQWSPLREF